VDEIAVLNRQISADYDVMEPYLKELKAIGKDFQAARQAFADAKAALAAAKGTGAEAERAAKAKTATAYATYQAALKKVQALRAKTVGGETFGEVLDRYFANTAAQETLVASVMNPYDTMSELEQETFDEKVGINRHADPGVGEAYTISSGGDPMKQPDGTPITTWNFHWGGVIMKSTTGSDNLTLENYAGSKPTAWVSQMYGVPTASDPRKGQTFQEQHRDDHRQHGESPTTLSTEKT